MKTRQRKSYTPTDPAERKRRRDRLEDIRRETWGDPVKRMPRPTTILKALAYRAETDPEQSASGDLLKRAAKALDDLGNHDKGGLDDE